MLAYTRERSSSVPMSYEGMVLTRREGTRESGTQQQRAWGRDDSRAMVEAKTRRFAGIRPAQGQIR